MDSAGPPVPPKDSEPVMNPVKETQSGNEAADASTSTSDTKPKAVVDRSVGHQRIDHQFSYPELDYDTPSPYQRLIKVSFLFKKLPDVSYEHFHEHYAHVHADLSVAAKTWGLFRIERYTQFHAFPDVRDKVSKLCELGTVEVLDYDACSSLWVHNTEDLINFFHSEDYHKLISDCDHFIDLKNGLKVMAGYELLIYGKATPDIDPKDGVLHDRT